MTIIIYNLRFLLIVDRLHDPATIIIFVELIIWCKTGDVQTILCLDVTAATRNNLGYETRFTRLCNKASTCPMVILFIRPLAVQQKSLDRALFLYIFIH